MENLNIIAVFFGLIIGQFGFLFISVLLFILVYITKPINYRL